MTAGEARSARSDMPMPATLQEWVSPYAEADPGALENILAGEEDEKFHLVTKCAACWHTELLCSRTPPRLGRHALQTLQPQC